MLHSKTCSIKHVERKLITFWREDLSVRLSSSSMSNRTGRFVADRPGRLGEHRSSESQIRILFDDQKEQIVQNAKQELINTNFKQPELKKSNDFFKDNYYSKIWNYVKLIREVSLKWKNSKSFRVLHSILWQNENSLRIRTLYWNFLAECRELPNEVNCMNDSKDFQDAESIRSGNSHVTNRPVSSPPHPVLKRMLRHSFVTPSRKKKAAKHLGHTWYIRKRFCKSRCVFFSTLSQRIESEEFIDRKAAFFIHSGEKWKTKTMLRSEMPVSTVSQQFSHLQWRKLFKELWGRPTTAGDCGSSFRQNPYTNHLCLLEDKVQDWGMYLFAISYGSDAMDQRSGDGWFCGWFNIFIINKKYFNAEFGSTWCEDCFSTEQNHP